MGIEKTFFDEVTDVRYVALYMGGEPQLYQRPGIDGASDSASDRYEEILVNPTILKLAKQRGDIDCGGLEYVLIRYGNFFQFVQAVPGGHISVAIEPSADIPLAVDAIRKIIQQADF